MVSWIWLVALSGLLATLVVGPWYALLRAVRAPVVEALAAAPGAAVTTVATSGILFQVVGLPWNTVSGLGVLCLPGVAAGALLVRGRRRPGAQVHACRVPARAAGLTGLSLAGLLGLRIQALGMKRPDAILQNHDAMFHLNLVDEITRTGDASMLTAAQALNSGMYPTAWHALAALLAPVAGVPMAFNATMLMTSVLLLPLGAVLLSRAVGARSAGLVAAPVLVTSTTWLPAFMQDFNAQVAAALSVALVAPALVLMSAYVHRPSPRRVVLMAVAIAGAGLAHAGAGQLLVLTALVPVGFTVLRGLHRAPDAAERRRARAATLVTCALVAAIPLLMMRSATLRMMGAFERDERSSRRALWDAVVLASADGVPGQNAFLALAGLLGLVLLAVVAHRWVLVQAWTVVIGLILLAATSEGAWWALVGGWWRDELRYRTVLTVLLAVGAAYVIELVARALAQAVRRRSNDLTATEVVAGVVVVGLLGATGQLHGAQSADWVRRGFDPEALIHPPWLTAAERDDLEALADAGAFPADAVVYGVPASGGRTPPRRGRRPGLLSHGL